jgi:hypothetical protein
MQGSRARCMFIPSFHRVALKRTHLPTPDIGVLGTANATVK